VLLDAIVKHVVAKAHDLKRGTCDNMLAVLWTDRHAYTAGNRVGELVKGERRDRAYEALWHELGRLRDCVVRIIVGGRKLIGPAAEP
jgi:hypothetical protein